MLVPTQLTIRGFRGFRNPETFHFDRRAALFFGGNGSGKSSTLNAIEWCLFGDDCLGKQTGIRERIGWEIVNRHADDTEAEVELELENAAGRHRIRRRSPRRAKRTSTGELQVTLPSGERLEGLEADRSLHRMLKSSFRDFSTMVYQHQEVIRAIVTQEPKDRNDAIDRLLGLSEYRNLLDGLSSVKARDRYKQLRQRFEMFEKQVEAAITARENDLREVRREAEQAGVPTAQQNAPAALALAAAAATAARRFAQDLGQPLPPLPVPNDPNGLRTFLVSARPAIADLLRQLPDVQEQQALFQKRQALANLKVQLDEAGSKLDEVVRQIQELDGQAGGEQSLAAQRVEIQQQLIDAEALLRTINSRAALVREAIRFLEESLDRGEECPLCGNSAPDLLAVLRQQWEGQLQAQVGKVEARSQETRGRKQRVDEWIQRHELLGRQRASAQQDMATRRADVGRVLNRVLRDEDDVLALLLTEVCAIDDRLAQLQQAVREKQQRLNQVDRDLDKLRLICDIVQKEEKRRLLEQIQETPAFREIEALNDQIAQWVSDLEAIQSAVAAAAHEEARDKLASAEQAIDGYFRELSRHPAVERIKLQVREATGHRNAYEITDQDERDLMPVLGQGDLNALALAMFLGLAAVSSDTAAFGFVMLDDPSQSLSTEHKRQLVKVLNSVAERKMVLVATMDAELRSLIREGLTKSKLEFAYGPWTPALGPRITCQ